MLLLCVWCFWHEVTMLGSAFSEFHGGGGGGLFYVLLFFFSFRAPCFVFLAFVVFDQATLPETENNFQLYLLTGSVRDLWYPSKRTVLENDDKEERISKMLKVTFSLSSYSQTAIDKNRETKILVLKCHQVYSSSPGHLLTFIGLS